MINKEKIEDFIIDYTTGIDLINCVNNSIENNFCKPDDYDDYGCKIDFLTEEKSSVKDKKSLDEWNMHHHNKFIKSKIDADAPTGFSFPPPYNFIEKDDIQINNIGDNTAEVEVSTRFGNYIFNVEDNSNDDNDYGMIIESVYMKPQWGGNLIKILG